MSEPKTDQEHFLDLIKCLLREVRCRGPVETAKTCQRVLFSLTVEIMLGNTDEQILQIIAQAAAEATADAKGAKPTQPTPTGRPQ